MRQLMYLSNAVNSMSNDELESLLDQARNNNLLRNITGMLVYHDGSFIQILEGEETDVRSLYETINKDPRHDNVILVEDIEIEKRSFPSWDMAFRQLSRSDIEQFPVLKNLLNINTQARTHVLTDIVEIFLDLIVDK